MRDSKTKRYDESLVEHIRTVQSYKNATAKPTEHAKEVFKRKTYETKRRNKWEKLKPTQKTE